MDVPGRIVVLMEPGHILLDRPTLTKVKEELEFIPAQLNDPSRAGSVPVRLLDDFQGILQADGYSGSWSGFGAASNTSVFTSPPSKTDTT